MVFLDLDAPGGTGKLSTLNIIISYIRMNNKNIASSASSSIATNLPLHGKNSPLKVLITI